MRYLDFVLIHLENVSPFYCMAVLSCVHFVIRPFCLAPSVLYGHFVEWPFRRVAVLPRDHIMYIMTNCL